MTDQLPTQPGPPIPPPASWNYGGPTSAPPQPPTWGSPPPAAGRPGPPAGPPARPWYRRGWVIAVLAFIAGGVVTSLGQEPTPAPAAAPVTSVVERQVFTTNCNVLEAAGERQACELDKTIQERKVEEAKREATATTAAPAPTRPKPVAATFGDGQFAVPGEVKPGTYRATNPDGNCYWARLKGFSGDLDDLLANGNPSGPARVTIARTDKGFESTRCGEWTKVG